MSEDTDLTRKKPSLFTTSIKDAEQIIDKHNKSTKSKKREDYPYLTNENTLKANIKGTGELSFIRLLNDLNKGARIYRKQEEGRDAILYTIDSVSKKNGIMTVRSTTVMPEQNVIERYGNDDSFHFFEDVALVEEATQT